MALAAYFVFGAVLHRAYEQYAWVLIGATLAAACAVLLSLGRPSQRRISAAS